MGLIDLHAHMRLADGELDRILTRMDALGVERAAVVGGGLLPPREIARRMAEAPTPAEGDVDFDNLALLAACSPAGGRLLPFYFANPWRGATAYREAGAAFSGLKLGPAVHGMPFHDPRIHELAAAAEGFGHCVYLHCLARPGLDIEDLCALARAFPRVAFILGHGGIGHMDLRAVELIEPLANVSFETSGAFSMAVRYAINTLGVGRVVYGSEYPLQDPRVELLKIECLDLDESAFHAVTAGNAERLLGRALHA